MDPYGRARDLSALLLATRFCLGTEHGEREIAGVSCYVSHRALIRPQVVNGPLSVLVMDREDDVNSIWTPARLVNLAWDCLKVGSFFVGKLIINWGVKAPFSTGPATTTTEEPSGFIAGAPKATWSLRVMSAAFWLTTSKVSNPFTNGFGRGLPLASTRGWSGH